MSKFIKKILTAFICIIILFITIFVVKTKNINFKNQFQFSKKTEEKIDSLKIITVESLYDYVEYRFEIIDGTLIQLQDSISNLYVIQSIDTLKK